jgi:hypothetical protein
MVTSLFLLNQNMADSTNASALLQTYLTDTRTRLPAMSSRLNVTALTNELANIQRVFDDIGQWEAQIVHAREWNYQQWARVVYGTDVDRLVARYR